MFHDDPSRLTADERTDEMAALLAAGFLRLKRRTRCLPFDFAHGPEPVEGPTGQKSPHVSAEESSEFRPESSGGSSRPTP